MIMLFIVNFVHHVFAQPLPPLVGLMDPNRFKKVSLCFIIAISITKPLSIPQQTIFLLLHMVINHEITIFDFSRFLFVTLTFWVMKSRRGSNGPVYPNKEARLLPGPKDPCAAEKGVKKE